MKIYLARHGETEFNLHKILMGQGFDIDIDKRGIKQAEELAKIVPREVNIIFSSPLRRAFHTAMIVSDALKVGVVRREELMERNFGKLQGKSWAEIEKTTGVSLDYIEEHLNVDLKQFNSEDVGLVKVRLMHFLADLKSEYSDKVPLVVTHSGIIRIMYILFPETPKLDVKNASIHTFEI